MAISINLTKSQYGIPFNSAYFRIVTTVISRTRDPVVRHNVMIDVAGYATNPADEDTKDVEFRRYNCPLLEVESQVGDTFLSKCYVWVMSQPDMIGSTGI